MIDNTTGIYSFTNTVNGKVYVGQSRHIEHRRGSHIRSLRRGKHSNSLIRADFAQHGEEAFRFEILEICALEIINERETFWISHYRSTEKDHGYNMDAVGKNNHGCSAETRAKISASNKGKKKNPSLNRRKSRSAESIARWIESRRGFKHSEASKKKLSMRLKGRVFSKEHRQKIAEANKRRIYSSRTFTLEHRIKLRDASLRRYAKIKNPNRVRESRIKEIHAISTQM